MNKLRRTKADSTFTLFLISLLCAHIYMLVHNIFIAPMLLSAIQNFLSLTFISFLCYLHSKRVKILKLLSILLLEVEVQVFIATLTLGWQTNFQNYYFTILPASFIISFSMSSKIWGPHITLEILPPLFYYILYFLKNKIQPVYQISDELLNTIQNFNTLFIFISIIVMAHIFQHQINNSIKLIRSTADHDYLTKLFNRRGIRHVFNFIDEEMSANKKDLEIAIFDIDDFKLVNDTYGHSAGDTVLTFIGKVLRSKENSKIACGRWGGEEFIVISHNSIDEEHIGIRTLMQDICTEISEHEFTFNKDSLHITVTAGCAKAVAGESISEMIETADKRLYIGKNSGKNMIISE